MSRKNQKTNPVLAVVDDRVQSRSGEWLSLWITRLDGRIIEIEMATHLPFKMITVRFNFRKA